MSNMSGVDVSSFGNKLFISTVSLTNNDEVSEVGKIRYYLRPTQTTNWMMHI